MDLKYSKEEWSDVLERLPHKLVFVHRSMEKEELSRLRYAHPDMADQVTWHFDPLPAEEDVFVDHVAKLEAELAAGKVVVHATNNALLGHFMRSKQKFLLIYGTPAHIGALPVCDVTKEHYFYEVDEILRLQNDNIVKVAGGPSADIYTTMAIAPAARYLA